MTDNVGNKNRRWHPRIAWNSAIKFKPHESKGEWEASRLHDISLGGCGFDSDVAFDIGEGIEIEIRSSLLKGLVKFLGAVKRCTINESTSEKRYAIAVHFVEMIEDEADSFIDTFQALMKKADTN